METSLFDITGKICIITGGSGLLGIKHAEASLVGGAIPVLIGRNEDRLLDAKDNLLHNYPNCTIECFKGDITDADTLEGIKEHIMDKYGHIDILINNAANNPKVESTSQNMRAIQFSEFPIETWEKDVAVGLTGAFLCCQIFGKIMETLGRGVILNISSDYGLRAPDQRIYRKKDVSDENQIIKPVTYSVVKHGIIGLTKYLAAYWGGRGIRSNTLCPSGIYDGQDEEFVEKYVQKIPLGRMSVPNDYLGTILYMISDASAFMNGATVVIDGGKTIW